MIHERDISETYNSPKGSRREFVNRELRTRLSIRAYHRAMRDVRDRHRDEFEHLLDLRREELGLYRDGTDVSLATASESEQMNNRRNVYGRKRSLSPTP